MTQKDLAEQLGVTPQYIHMIEAGRAKPSEQRLNELATALGDLAEEFLATAVSQVEDEFAEKLREAGLSPVEIEEAARRVSIRAKQSVVSGEEPLRIARQLTPSADLLEALEADEEIVAMHSLGPEESKSPLDYAKSIKTSFDVRRESDRRMPRPSRRHRATVDAGPRARIIVEGDMTDSQRRALEDLGRVIKHLLKN